MALTGNSTAAISASACANTCKSSLRVCLIGDVAPRPAEGMQNVFRHLFEGLSSHAAVLGLDGRDLARGRGWVAVRRFRPHVLHYVAGPSPASFILLRALRLLVPKAACVVSSIHPLGLGNGRLTRLARPDILLTQAEDTEILFQRWGIRTHFVPNGVATDRFRPADVAARRDLRRRYGVPQERTVILHVGHLKRERNVLLLRNLQGVGTQVIVVGSTATNADTGLRADLEDAGVLVWNQHFPQIEEIYQLADIYVFPTLSRTHCIETPLSVLEAAACDLAIVSTRFGALPRIFSESSNFTFVSEPPDIPAAVDAFRLRPGRVQDTCADVQRLDWRYIVKQVLDVYAETHPAARSQFGRGIPA